MRTTPQQQQPERAGTGGQPLRCKATVSHRIPDSAFPFRVFYYSPGMGFDTGNLVGVGFNEYRTEAEAREAATKWEEATRHV